jgi:hypothetical protein
MSATAAPLDDAVRAELDAVRTTLLLEQARVDLATVQASLAHEYREMLTVPSDSSVWIPRNDRIADLERQEQHHREFLGANGIPTTLASCPSSPPYILLAPTPAPAAEPTLKQPGKVKDWPTYKCITCNKMYANGFGPHSECDRCRDGEVDTPTTMFAVTWTDTDDDYTRVESSTRGPYLFSTRAKAEARLCRLLVEFIDEHTLDRENDVKPAKYASKKDPTRLSKKYHTDLAVLTEVAEPLTEGEFTMCIATWKIKEVTVDSGDDDDDDVGSGSDSE